MALFIFSTLASGAHLDFDPLTDVLHFDATTISANEVRVAVSGEDLSLTVAGKTIWLDGVGLNLLAIENFEFADGSSLVLGDGTGDSFHDAYGQSYPFSGLGTSNQVWGSDGADFIATGSGSDWLVGNVALAPLNHVSRVGTTGSPTSSTMPTVSADGRFVAFAGGWTQFGSSSNSATDVLVKDLVTGLVGNEHVDGVGDPGLSGSGSPVISADGRWLVFNSSSGLVPGTPPSNTLYMAAVGGADIQAISTTSGNAAYADRGAYLPDVSGSGRYVVYSSDATNLAAGSTSTTVDVFLKDVVTGEVVRVSTSTTGGDGNGDSGYLGNAAYTGAKISADGDYVVFQSAASNLTSSDTNGRTDIFLYTVATGDLVNLTQGLVAVSNPNNGNVKADVAYNGDSRAFVVFETARNLVAADTSNGTDIYALNFKNGAITLVSSRADGSGVALSSEDASISDDGRWVVFTSYSDDLVEGDTNGTRDIFVKDLTTGAIALVSKNGSVAGNGPSLHAKISSGGDWIVFESAATNLASTDGNAGFTDVYRVANPLLRDTLVGGAGDDTYVLSRADLVRELANGGLDTVQASINYALGANVENLVLTGSANLNGIGNGLNNVITGNAGNNVLNGGDGVDTVSYANATGAVTVSLATATAQATGFGSDTLSNFENIVGSAFNDRLTGNTLANRLDGGLGGDTLTGGAGNDTYVVNAATDITVEAVSAGTDTVISSVNWTLQSTLENLTLAGTTATTGNGNGTHNVLTGNAANNVMNAGAGNDTVNGGAGNDSLQGSTGNDRLDGGTGNDTLFGGEGSDIYVADSSADNISEAGTTASDVDTVYAGVNWTLGATLENLTLTGSAATGSGNSRANVILGNAGANTLSAGSGDDTVSGGSGNDTINGSTGSDRLTGGSGNDVIVLNTRIGSDNVTDFVTATDDIRISQAGIRIGDGDTAVEDAVRLGGPGGFSSSAELVIITGNAASLATSAAATAIGAATTAYTVGRTALFAVDNGSSTGIYLFTAADANTQVSASELTLLATLSGTSSTSSLDYVFSA